MSQNELATSSVAQDELVTCIVETANTAADNNPIRGPYMLLPTRYVIPTDAVPINTEINRPIM